MPVGPICTPALWHITQYIRNNVRFGYNAMPAFRISEVSPKELNAIVAYMKEVAAYRKVHPEYQPAAAQEGGKKK